MLRSATHRLLAETIRDQHRRLDRHPNLARLLSRQVSTADYAHGLRLMYGGFRLVEPVILAYEQIAGQNDERSYVPRLPALEADLQVLGVDAGGVWTVHTVAVAATQGTYLGTRYVLEGSALGAARIAAHLDKQLPALHDQAFRFWSVQRQALGHWPAFLAELGRLDTDPAGQAEAVAAATATLDIFLEVCAKDHGERTRY